MATSRLLYCFNFRKQWILFPSEKTSSLLPTRIPYEESSIYSNVNFYSPDPDIANGNYYSTFSEYLISNCHFYSLKCGCKYFSNVKKLSYIMTPETASPTCLIQLTSGSYIFSFAPNELNSIMKLQSFCCQNLHIVKATVPVHFLLQ